MKSTIFYSYLATGLAICIGFAVAAKAGWRIPVSGVSSGASHSGPVYFGRSFGGSWGSGK